MTMNAESPVRAVLIAQMTDIHVGFAPEDGEEELNLVRFRATLKRLLEGPNRPDMLVLSGDITDRGDAASFAKTAALLADCPFPVLPLVGNHDSREALRTAFPQEDARAWAQERAQGPVRAWVQDAALRPRARAQERPLHRACRARGGASPRRPPCWCGRG